ncbi:hypothetical protein BMR85_029050, partial [Achromobacter sp. KAs 3-5]
MNNGGVALWSVGTWFGGFTNWWNSLNVGNLSEAGGAVANFLVVVVTLWLTFGERKRIRNAEAIAAVELERQEQRSRYANVEAVSFELIGSRPGSAMFSVYNYSDCPIYDVELIPENLSGRPVDWWVEWTLNDKPVWKMATIAARTSAEKIFLQDDRFVPPQWSHMWLVFTDVHAHQWLLRPRGGPVHIGSSSFAETGFDARIKKIQESNDPAWMRTRRWAVSRWAEHKRRMELKEVKRRARRAVKRAQARGERATPPPTRPNPPAQAPESAPPD